MNTTFCLVYDPAGYCKSPVALESDLSRTEGEFRAVIIICPKRL
jgi:hypothetical protein